MVEWRHDHETKYLIDRVASLPEDLLDEVEESLDVIEHERVAEISRLMANSPDLAAFRGRAWSLL